MNYNPLEYHYTSRRNLVYGKKGMVATSQPLAAQAGLDILKKGGNAIDAAIATAACLTVVEPTSNGIGGDAFAIVWTRGRLYGLNSSGPAPKGISLNHLKDAGYEEVPKYGLIPVTVPGTPAAWAELSQRFGKLSLSKVLEPAIKYAIEGHPVAPNVAILWAKAYSTYKEALKGEEFKYWFDTFTLDGRPPRTGEVWSSLNLGKTLQIIGESKAKSFYRGELADKIHEFFVKYGGYLRKKDLEEFHPEWVEPISINYRGYDIWEIPPNGHGIVVLMALNILKGFEFNTMEVETYHRQIEAMKLAFADGLKYVADKGNMSVGIEELLSDKYAIKRRGLIKKNAITPIHGQPSKGGTVYLATADEEGNMVSFIQSNYMGFGSGIVIPETGIALHNRGSNFTLDPEHDNCLMPGKRPYHTIIPGFITKDNQAIGPFGVMGGFMQPQGHIQVIINSIDFNLNPQDALDAPRWMWVKGKTIELEKSFPSSIIQGLINKGHDIRIIEDSINFGRGQIIWRDKDGILVGGTEPRADGAIAVW